MPTKEQDIADNRHSMFTAKQVADILNVSTRTVHRLRSSRELPSPVEFGGNVRWRRSVIESWISDGCPSDQI
ncbi:DNA binding domain-containing protein, excisionase family [Planctomicrobium piriforme]|uniref:DNA binding domain-containing protein, excisionase family n=2 Tax=Planctomicrobium piriforme TaxID=1576369 RepID=A0A1I3KCT2_9PLAN|nr:DNA binding domain-containing protein, excisionase family [Planctomicrobium piriforme]